MNGMREIRDLRLEDTDSIRPIISNNWFKGPTYDGIRDAVIDNFISRYFRRSGQITVASVDGVVAGFVACCGVDEPFRADSGHFDEMFDSTIKILSGSEKGRSYLEEYKRFDADSEEMLSHVEYGFEMILFAVDPAYQRIGIGKELIRHMVDHYKLSGANKMALITSGMCDVDFYVHRGYKLESKKMSSFLDRKNDIFVFSADL